MRTNRYRNAWVWLAVAAMAAVSLARVEAGANATVDSNSVLAFLSGQQNVATLSAGGGPQIVRSGSTGKVSGVYLHDAASGAWTAMLPVLFIGLLTPLSLISRRSMLSRERTPAVPALPCSFQRPPPALL
ncbi:MAG TPA: hypothetical protein VGL00_13975 [Terracidiphilus sp.]